MLQALLIGVVRGMAGPELAEWVDNLPGKLGQEVGALVRANLDPNGELSREGTAKLREWLSVSSDRSQDLLAGLSGRITNSPEASDSLIPDYLAAISFVIRNMVEIKRPIVLQGFFHTPHCISYWHFNQNDFSYIKLPETDGDVINCYGNPDIYIIEEEPSEDRLRDLNLQVRQRPDHALPFTLYGTYSTAKKVQRIGEFAVEFGGLGILGSSTADIPLEADGLMAMLTSVQLAREAQGSPKRRLSNVRSFLGAEDRAKEVE
jgi:hypothetical protein